MSNSPLRGLTRSPSRSRGAFSAPGLSRRVLFVSTASPLPLPTLRRASAPNPWRQLQLRPRNEGAGGAPGGALPVRRARRARRHACEAWGVPRKSGTPPLGAPPWRCRPRNRSGPGTICGIRRSRLLTASHCHGGLRHRAFRSRLYGPLSTPLPAPPAGSSPETPLMSEDDKCCTIYSLRSQ